MKNSRHWHSATRGAGLRRSRPAALFRNLKRHNFPDRLLVRHVESERHKRSLGGLLVLQRITPGNTDAADHLSGIDNPVAATNRWWMSKSLQHDLSVRPAAFNQPMGGAQVRCVDGAEVRAYRGVDATRIDQIGHLGQQLSLFLHVGSLKH